MTEDELDRLSGVELRRRLEQRGLNEGSVELLLSHRDNCDDCRDFLMGVLP